ncbi:hypothetical protein ACWEOE_31680 [Amycolatopsis sp. NPDC004368]
MISWKLFWTAAGAVVTGAAAALMALAGAPVGIGGLLFLLAGVVFVACSRSVVFRASMFEQVSFEGQQQIARWLAAAAAAHVGWGLLFLLRPELWLVWIAGLAAIAGLEYGVARGHEYMLTQLKPAPEKPTAIAEPGADERGADSPMNVAVQALQSAFQLSGHDWLEIRSATGITSGLTRKPVGAAFVLRIPPRMAVTTAKGKKTAEVTKLDANDAEKMAIALSTVLGMDLHSSWVTLTKAAAAGAYELAVLLEDALAETYVYVDDPTPSSITEPYLDGHEIDGTPHYTRADQHGADTGLSRMGKSSRINCKFAHVTRCTDAVLWVCGTVKLYDGLAGWIEPYMNEPFKIPFNWIASGPEHTLLMLATAFTIARWRQNQPLSARADFKTIIVQLDEAGFALPMTSHFIKIEGEVRTMSALVRDIQFGAGSAGVWVHLAGQRATDPNWGPYSTDINSGMSWQTVFRTGDIAEIGRATGDWALPNPEHKGEYWLNPGPDAPVVKLKAPYMQENDPSKPKLHDGPTVSDVAWARRFLDIDLDAGSARVAREFAGAVFANRHRYADDSLMEYLTGQHVVASSEETLSPFDEAKAQLLAELDEIESGADWAAAEPAVASAPAAVAQVVAARPLKERVLSIVSVAQEPMSREEILVALGGDGGPEVTSAQTVTNALTALVRDGELQRPVKNTYLPKAS